VRARDHGFAVGQLPPGPANSITDVAGVRVGHANAHADHTGVTAVWPHAGDPFSQPYFCATAALNGAGELTGAWEIDEWGARTTPVFLTGTSYVGAVYNGATHVLTARHPAMARDEVIIPVVGECDPSSWCDLRDGPEPGDEMVASALDEASGGATPEGQVGAGVGMETFGFAAGIGTSSRVVGGHVVGVLVLSNFGLTERFVLCGRPVGRELAREAESSGEGSCICLVATDAPLLPHQLKRLARRPFIGLARTGSYGSHGSGEIAFAWTTANLLQRVAPAVTPLRMLDDELLSVLFAACAEAAEEAVLNALCAGRELRGYSGRELPRFPAERFAVTAGA
jgi:D-aminopeptidase